MALLYRKKRTEVVVDEGSKVQAAGIRSVSG
jgi:hypothetical protein